MGEGLEKKGGARGTKYKWEHEGDIKGGERNKKKGSGGGMPFWSGGRGTGRGIKPDF